MLALCGVFTQVPRDSRPPPPPSLAPCPAVPRSYALLLRGEPYRFGCSGRNVEVQDAAMRSHHQMITRSLQGCGHRVDVFLTIDRRSCANKNDSLIRQMAFWHGDTAQETLPLLNRSTSQATNVRAALDYFRPMAPSYDVLILSRYDLVLKHAMREWPGYQGDQHSSVAVGSMCPGVSSWSWNCSTDVIFIVPRTLLWAFDEAVGAPPSQQAALYYDHWDAPTRRRVYGTIMANACFMSHGEVSSKGAPRGTGHGCYNAIAQRIGYERLSTLWPVGQNGNNGRFYQCCQNGLGSLAHSLKDGLHIDGVSDGARANVTTQRHDVSRG